MDNRVVFRLLVELILIGNFATAYDNIALRKFAWQQYPYTGRPLNFARAYKAVDGLYSNRSVFGGQCTISGNAERTATWTVDLGRILSIHHITIYFRTDDIPWDENNAYTERLLGFSVYISNTSDKFDGYLCFKDTKYTKTTVPNTTTIECINHGQYVIYYNERLPGVTYPVGYSHFAYSDLCELEIYGCPTTGVYGENCTLPCSQSCQERHCNILDGACLGCLTGYKGPRCEEQCDNYKYGFECTFTCGNCSNGEQCHHVNGRCTNGCDVGAQGYTCDEACPFGRHGKNCDEFCNPNCKGGCNRFTGVCEFGCYPGWKGWFCENECALGFHGYSCNETCNMDCFNGTCDVLIGSCPQVVAPDPNEINIVHIIGGAVAVIIVCLAVVLLFFVFRRKSTNGTDKEQNQTEKRAEQMSSENTTPNMDIYDKISDNGLYQELGPRREVSDYGEYQELGPRIEIYDKSKDNTVYLELGQISQLSHYDKLH